MSPNDEAIGTLEKWAGSQHLGLTLVFTDIVDSTLIGVKLGDDKWINDLFVHFSRAREIASGYDCFIVKVIGDSLMMAFRTSSQAVKFAMDFATNTGVDHIGIRVGINSGEVQIRENDIYGLNVNFTSRVQSASARERVLVSNSVKRDYEKTLGTGSSISFRKYETDLKSFGRETLWKAGTDSWFAAIKTQRKVRRTLLDIQTLPSWIL